MSSGCQSRCTRLLGLASCDTRRGNYFSWICQVPGHALAGLLQFCLGVQIVMATPRTSVKSSAAYSQYQQKRRNEALEQQRKARGDRLQLARVLAGERMEAAGTQNGPRSGGGQRAAKQSAWTGCSPMGMAVESTMGDHQATVRADGSSTVDVESGCAWGPHPTEPLSGADLRRHYAQQLMLPEWLTDIPPDLGTEWLAMPRPEGRRCLVIAAHGLTAVRARSGALLGRCQTRLPGGSRETEGSGDFTVVDAVLVEGGNLFRDHQQQLLQQDDGKGGDTACCNSFPPGCCLFVSDVIAWRGVMLAGCGAECRAFWLAARMAELCSDGNSVAASAGSGAEGPMLRGLPALPATCEGLESVVRGSCSGSTLGFVQDGCYLLHKEGHYQPGHAPLALLWKDESCSRYMLDTDADGVVPDRQQVVLQYRADATVATEDDPPVVLGRMPPDWVSHMGPKLLRPGRLLRFSVGDGGLSFVGGRPVGADLKYEGPANQRRGRADALSKVLFQSMVRVKEAPSLEQLQRITSGSVDLETMAVESSDSEHAPDGVDGMGV